MSEYRYKPYYKFNGPTREQPFREELSADEVEQRLERFASELMPYFEGISGVVIRHLEGGVVSVAVGISQQKCDDIVKKCLNELDLFAYKV